MNKRKIIFLFLILLFLYFSGFFFKPKLEYFICVKIPEEILILRDINLYVPFPSFTFLPYFQVSSPIREVEISSYVAAKSKNSSAFLIDTKYGKMLKINISKLSYADTELETQIFKIHFTQNLPLSYLFTPFYLFKEPEKIYSLRPLEEKWRWEKKTEKIFIAKKDVSTFIYCDFPYEEIFLKIRFIFKKRINPFGGYLFVKQEISGEDGDFLRINKKGWQKYNLKEISLRKFF